MAMISLAYRIAGLIFLLIAVTVSVMIYLMNQQMAGLFGNYLVKLYGHLGMAGMHGMHGSMMGQSELDFLESVHQSLIWVGGGIMAVGLGASFLLARSITIPLRKLNAAAREIEKGHFDQRVDVHTNDEVEELAHAFNRMSETLETNHRLRKQFLADVAHELRTPLTIIQGNLEGMMEGVIEPDREQLESLHEETLHLNHLIHDLRDLSLAEAGQLRLEKQPVHIYDILVKAAGGIQPLAEAKGVTVACRGTDTGVVLADENRISQVIHNLLTNAVRYTPPGGFVTVESGYADRPGLIFFSVQDTGVGISEGDLPHVFDHFYRADKSRDRKSGGTGIGLAIVKQLAELHGGYVKAESHVGKGSVFTVFLPCGKENAAIKKQEKQ
jgi:two-component system sensor histidine kinase BaeS